MIAPTAIDYQNKLIQNVSGLKSLNLPVSTYASQLKLIELLSKHLNEIIGMAEEMRQERKLANQAEEVREKAIHYDEKVKIFFDKIAYHINKLEQIVDDKKWPLPKLRELLFVK